MVNGTITLFDDSIAIIHNADDLVRLVRGALGFDAGQMLQLIVDQANFNEQKMQTDLASYESQLESQNTAFEDINEIVQQMKYELSQDRLNRSVMKDLVDDLISLLSNHL